MVVNHEKETIVEQVLGIILALVGAAPLFCGLAAVVSIFFNGVDKPGDSAPPGDAVGAHAALVSLH